MHGLYEWPQMPNIPPLCHTPDLWGRGSSIKAQDQFWGRGRKGKMMPTSMFWIFALLRIVTVAPSCG